MTIPAIEPFISRTQSPPRKVRIATTMRRFAGPLGNRLLQVRSLIEEAAQQIGRRYPAHPLDLMILPEYALQNDSGDSAHTKAVRLAGEVGDLFSAQARQHRTYILGTMILDEGDVISNAAVLFDRAGEVVGIYRKVHPVSAIGGDLEGGTIPGDDYPVFSCDFGKLGVLICFDMNYDCAWKTLSGNGAEIVAIPSASPQTLRPLSQALRHACYVVTATPRDNASIFNPIGLTIAQRTSEGVLVQEIDLAYAILHWSAALDNGRALTRAYGEAVGYDYSSREDTGVFWSNDPTRPIGEMLREQGLEEMHAQLARCLAERDATRSR